jgi:S-adenosylmethionine:tRNA ribosyltransferase-isomerase
MRVDQFDFDLPDDRIALRPAEPRDAARMLVLRPGAPFEDRGVRDLPDLLQPGDALVFNDTRVIPGQLKGERFRDGGSVPVSATLHMRVDASRWLAFAKPGRRLAVGDRIRFGGHGTSCLGQNLDATLEAKNPGGDVLLAFDMAGPVLDEAIKAHGAMPLPPYIAAKRGQDARDASDYQTVYAREDGAVAAPTAGLHFTDHLLAAIDAAGIERHFLTLHVGAGTFLPVKAEDTRDHRMHSEIGIVTHETAAALNAVKAGGGRIVAVGTTSLRLLESACGADGELRPFAGPTDIFITPGYEWRFTDALMTNFHLPKSTLFMLVSAFCGLDRMQAAYGHAISSGYRFYSYGDSSLLFRALK